MSTHGVYRSAVGLDRRNTEYIPRRTVHPVSPEDTSASCFFKILCNVLEGKTDPDEWHEALTKCLQKKGDTSDPNNWRAI